MAKFITMKRILPWVIYFLLCIPERVKAKVVYFFPVETSREIQGKVDKIAAYDTLYFNAGTFHLEGLVIIKPCTVTGDMSAILDGAGTYELITISSESVAVRNLNLQNSGYSSMNDYAAIKIINAKNVLIENTRITGAYFAIHISNSSYCTIRNNVITGKSISEQLNGNAIHLWKCNHMTIEQNEVSHHRDGIYLEFVTHSVIKDNVSTHQLRYGLHFMFSNDDEYACNTFEQNGAGVAVMYSHNVMMKRNVFKNNWGPSAYGLLLKDISDGEISENEFKEDTRGIQMEGSNRISIHHNEFKDDGWGLAIQANCAENNITNNNFINNSFDISTNGDVTLNAFDCNYWDEYEGYDLNKDGIGDIPYHPLSLMAVMIEQNPSLLILVKSFMMQLFERMEKSIPTLTPEHFVDLHPMIKSISHDPNRTPE